MWANEALRDGCRQRDWVDLNSGWARPSMRAAGSWLMEGSAGMMTGAIIGGKSVEQAARLQSKL